MTGTIARYRVDLLLVALVFVVLGPIVASNSAQPSSRLDLTAAIAEHGSVDITRYPIGVDYSVVHGRKRSDKPPGQPLLAVPVYAAARVAGAESAQHLRQHGDLTLWWITFWSATVPFAFLLVMMRRAAARIAPRAALPATLCLGFGSLLLPFSVNLFGHVLAAAFAFAAWYTLDHDDRTPSRTAFGGFLAGMAVLVEYEAVIVAAVLLAAAVVRHHRRFGAYIAGAALPLLTLAMYQTVAFGAPWRVSYANHARRAGIANVGLHVPFGTAWDMLLSPSRGYILVSPLVLVALGAAIWLAGRGDARTRLHARVALAVFAGYWIVVACTTDGSLSDFPGTRYLVVALPFFAVPLAAAWSQVRRAAVACAIWGGLVMAGATFTGLLVGAGEPLLHAYTKRLRAHVFEPTVWSIGFGRTGVVLYLVTIAVVVAAVVRIGRTSGEREALALEATRA